MRAPVCLSSVVLNGLLAVVLPCCADSVPTVSATAKSHRAGGFRGTKVTGCQALIGEMSTLYARNSVPGRREWYEGVSSFSLFAVISPDTHPESVPDLTACEREPVHTPGAVEPHGVLLALDTASGQIVQASVNCISLLGIRAEDLISRSLPDVFAGADAERLQSCSSGEGRRAYAGSVVVRQNGSILDALVHQHQGLLIVELEPVSPVVPAAASQDMYATFTDAAAELSETVQLTELCQRVASRVRLLTGFDRVMVYRFLGDDSGEVIAEEAREGLSPYLGLRYPASDIPAQARVLYRLNTIRLKPDVNARAATLAPPVNPVTGSSLDMTYCALRAMSPVHTEYLRNMGVGASMSISILKDDRLWGLIACHHATPFFVPHRVRITCEILARVFSSRIAAAEIAAHAGRTADFRELAANLTLSLQSSDDVLSTLAEEAAGIAAAMRAGGVVFSLGGKKSAWGQAPQPEHLKELTEWLTANQHDYLFQSECLSGSCRLAERFGVSAAGLLSVRISLSASDFLLFFRPAVTQVINWAGNPDKPVEETEAGKRISPRRSFELWKQTLGGRSETWDEIDSELALQLRGMVAESLLRRLNEDILRLNDELTRSNVELDAFAYAASHDLQEPVRMIRSYAQLLLRRQGTDLSAQSREFLSVIETSAQRMAGLISSLLSYSQLGGSDRPERGQVEIGDVLRWVLVHLGEMIRESGAEISADPLPAVKSDPDHMMQLFQNLLANAIKYRQTGVPPSVRITAECHDRFWHFSVSDNGRGFQPDQAELIFQAFKRLEGREIPGTGIGLATCRRIVELHGGRIWAESPGENQGATFRFMLPA